MRSRLRKGVDQDSHAGFAIVTDPGRVDPTWTTSSMTTPGPVLSRKRWFDPVPKRQLGSILGWPQQTTPMIF
jgi:hypothetical protein